MTEMEDPREQLRVIRSLMERATIYRAISAPTALVGGLLSIGAWGLAWQAAQESRPGLSDREFVLLWLGVLALTSASNAFFLWRGALGRGENFFSSGMKTALASVAPPFFAAGICTLVVPRPVDLCVLWMVFYGLALLATQHFAPRSLVLLGAAFLMAGCGLALFGPPLLLALQAQPSTLTVSAIMASAFGGIHVAYAVAVWTLGEERGASEA